MLGIGDAADEADDARGALCLELGGDHGEVGRRAGIDDERPVLGGQRERQALDPDREMHR